MTIVPSRFPERDKGNGAIYSVCDDLVFVMHYQFLQGGKWCRASLRKRCTEQYLACNDLGKRAYVCVRMRVCVRVCGFGVCSVIGNAQLKRQLGKGISVHDRS